MPMRYEITLQMTLKEARYRGKPVSLVYNKWIRYPYMTRYKAGIALKEMLRQQEPPVFVNPVQLTFTLLVGSPSKTRDLHGFCAIPDKLICDWLVEKGALSDDSIKYIHKSTYQWKTVRHIRIPQVHVLVEEICQD